MDVLHPLSAGLIRGIHIDGRHQLTESIRGEFFNMNVLVRFLDELFNILDLLFLYFNFLLDGENFLFQLLLFGIVALTHHVETVVLLSKLKVDHHIEIELKMDELDLTAAESKATYDEIKAYVLNKYGLKVSQLYIAQIKRKCGIIERKNYNVSKKEDAKVPQCPPEKEAAIMDALKHFQMI